jgi:hypothetical protein
MFLKEKKSEVFRSSLNEDIKKKCRGVLIRKEVCFREDIKNDQLAPIYMKVKKKGAQQIKLGLIFNKKTSLRRLFE